MTKINFKQPKYIFPLVIAFPLIFLAYIIADFSRMTRMSRWHRTDSTCRFLMLTLTRY